MDIQQAWMVMGLAPVESYLPDDLKDWPSFEHLCTNVREGVSADGRRIGETVWGGVIDGHEAAVAWDWVEMRPGLMCLLDLNSFVSNIRFLDEGETYQEPLQAMVSMNRLAHHWSWQRAAIDALRRGAVGLPARPLTASRARPALGVGKRPGPANEIRQAA